MPRHSRPMPGGLCVHVVTRGNARSTVFHDDLDYAGFTQLLREAQERVRVELLAWCLMPNHVHLVIRPRADGDLARWMHWLLTTHVQRHRIRYDTTGRIWQGRYKSFPIQEDLYLLTVLRYVERNPVRAGLTSRSIAWRWSSARERWAPTGRAPELDAPPIELPQPWATYVDTPLTGTELDIVRTSVKRCRPLGNQAWTRAVAKRLDLMGTLRSRGRPMGRRSSSSPVCNR